MVLENKDCGKDVFIGCFLCRRCVSLLLGPYSLGLFTGVLCHLIFHSYSTIIVSIIRIFSMNSLVLSTNLTGTMVYADFLSAFEVNLGILCVSLPMLGPIYHRYIRRGPPTSSTKLSGHASSGALRTFGTGPRKHYRLEDDPTYTVTADGKGSPNGSDIELNPYSRHSQAIKVEREWTVQVSSK